MSYINTDMCKKCGGLCCKRFPGIYAPEDFQTEITEDFIISLLDTKRYCIDYYIGNRYEDEIIEDGMLYFIRPLMHFESVIAGELPPREIRRCVNLQPDKYGCKLSFENRPYQCRKLIPNYPLTCTTKLEDKASKSDMAQRWIPYNNILKKIVKEYVETNKEPASEF